MAWPPPCPGKGGTQTARSSYARWAAVVALRAWIALTELTNALETTAYRRCRARRRETAL